ncbi:phosphoribosyl-AMP cyclohydrolase [Candidatus Pacearchaeota archaeon]|nr:phosphoribosyl-AMP cyclohydrolase [Candidatus Pacearchaeota archaeon]
MIELDFDKMDGLVPVIIQDYKSLEILMLGFMNEEAWHKTLETGKVHFYSRTRKKLWMKGESSGNVQIVKRILLDCDNDTLLIKAEQVGGKTCHTGERSCFYTEIRE